jgi:formylglycine-generating enzyme required for sulfatase activity
VEGDAHAVELAVLECSVDCPDLAPDLAEAPDLDQDQPQHEGPILHELPAEGGDPEEEEAQLPEDDAQEWDAPPTEAAGEEAGPEIAEETAGPEEEASAEAEATEAEVMEAGPEGDAPEITPAEADETGQPQVPPGFVLVEPAAFVMGSPPDEPGRGNDEAQHQVQLTHRLLVAVREVTQAEWRAAFPATPVATVFTACGEECPAENVNWWSAVKYCNQRSQDEGLAPCYTLAGCSGIPGMDFECDQASFEGPGCVGYRLPTEAEWEFVARAGTTTALYTGPLPVNHLELFSPEADAIGWYGGNSGVSYAGAWDCSGWKETQYPAQSCGAHPSAGKAANPWGLFDVAGNVWEWCWDAWEPFVDGVAATDPLGASDPSFRVLRGGSWMTGAARLRSANRGRYEPTVRNGTTGLRVVREVPLELLVGPGGGR